MGIVVNNLNKSYGQQKAIEDLSFTARSDEIVGLIGPNGAGKTTTMKILTCFMPPDSGHAEIYGFDIQKQAEEIKRIVGYLPEHNPLYGEMYLREYLLFVCRIHGLSQPYKKIDNIIERVGLGRESHKKLSALSKGYKQRVGIAQAIIHDPKVLILDEPISGLDPNQLIEIRALIRELKKDKTIIFSSHILQEVETICDKVLILSDGKLIRDDSMQNINIGREDRIVLHLEVTRPLNLETLTAIQGIDRVEMISKKACIIRAGRSDKIREHLFDMLVKENNKVLQMAVKQDSLENIFKEITQDRK